MPLVEIDGRMVQVGRPKCIGKRVGFGLREELMPWYFFRIKDSEERNFPTKYLNGLINEDREELLRGDTLESQEVIRRYREYLEETGQHDRLVEEEAEEMGKVYGTIYDVVSEYVEPALGEYVDNYDAEAIAREITEWHHGETTTFDGFVVTKDGEERFFEIAARHDKTAGEGV